MILGDLYKKSTNQRQIIFTVKLLAVQPSSEFDRITTYSWRHVVLWFCHLASQSELTRLHVRIDAA